MIDIVSVENGQDLGTYDTQVEKAKNILSIQLGSLFYAPDLGIDLKYFLDENYKFQTESFRSYLIETLAANGVNVASVLQTIDALSEQLTFTLSPPETQGSLVAR